MVAAPYYADDLVTLYLGDCREVLPAARRNGRLHVVTDPPYCRAKQTWSGTAGRSAGLR